MEKRVLLAIVLTLLVVVGTNLLFPPAPPPSAGSGADTVAVDTAAAADTGAEEADQPAEGLAATAQEDTADRPPLEAEERADPEAEEDRPAGQEEEGRVFGEAEPDTTPGEGVTVTTPLATYRFSTRGAAITGIELSRYASYAESDSAGKRAQLVREGDRLLTWRLAAGGDTVDLAGHDFQASATELTVEEGGEARTLTFRDSLPEYAGLAFEVTYRFSPESYLVNVEGELQGIGSQGYVVLSSLGRGLRTNEAEPDTDFDQLAYAVNSRGGGIQTNRLDDVEEGRQSVEGAPFRWVAVKNKYFLVSLVAPESGPAFGGLLVEGLSEENAAAMEASYPVPGGEPGFRLGAYLGPQEFDRLSAVGQDLQNVNPYGWEWLSFIIRPLVGLIMTIFTWAHTTLDLAYGWVLILFGVAMRVVLFPLYQKSMRAQMAQMEVQPKIKELQSKYEDDPQKLQQEMVKVYKEHNLNPLAGCLPMLLPFPILITLFFVFQNTIEVRGVSFWWLPDLSLADPYYIIPVVMGLSMFLLQYIGQRGMERNLQMKLMSYGLPVMFTLLFLRFPAGLNLYYATSNLASLPQQFFLSKERRKMQSKKGKKGE